MNGCYCADLALQTAVFVALEFYGLDPAPAAANRRPQPAGTLAEQMRRIDLGGKVLALVRRSVPVAGDDRLLIERLVDSACERSEHVELEQPRHAGATAAAVIAYAVAGGGAVGSFDSFRRSFTSSAELLEPAVDRQDVQPAPMRDPRRRPPPPGTAAPAKTNPTRTIRSSRWSGAGKGARS
jgi:hypothetical protein